MLRSKNFIILWLLAIGCFTGAYAQKATEVYIPIGQSPGISGNSSVIGTVESIDIANSTITVLYDNKRYTGTIDTESFVYLDRSKYRKKNTIGDLTDCKAGSNCEMTYQYKEGQQTDIVKWLKVEVEE